MLKEFFANLKLKRQVNKEFKKFYKEQKSITIADRLAKKSCKWVELLWNGEKYHIVSVTPDKDYGFYRSICTRMPGEV